MTGPQPPDLAPDGNGGPAGPIDDAALGRIVRDVAAGWEMPPVRLDAPSWRDRVRTPRTRRIAAARGWFGRLGQAATAAVVLTVSAALLAVWLTQPPQVAKPSESTGNATPAPSLGVGATPLPKLLVEGDLPSPTNVLVQLEAGDYARVDLAKGSVGSPLTGSSWPSDLRQRIDGSMVCFCYTRNDSATGGTHLAVSLVRLDATGGVISRTPVGEFDGAPDPRDGAIPEQPQHLVSAVTYTADGRYALIGWSGRAHPVWHSGFVVVDVQDGSVVGNFALPDRSDGEGDVRQSVDAPRMVGAIGGDKVAISRGWYTWSPAASSSPTYHFGSDVYTAGFDAGQLSDVQLLAGADGCGDVVQVAGARPGGGAWLVCPGNGSVQTVIRRIGADGAVLGDSHVYSATGFGDESAFVLSADGSTLYLWDPTGLVLSRVDLASGTVDAATAPTTAGADDNPLTALGNWLAPSAAAKAFLRWGIAISPDGARIYALGIRALASDQLAGSAGLFVFDASAMKLVNHWAPTADFVSLAVSADGQFVYAAGLPGTDAGGRQTSQPASITVFDATDGTIRLIAGELGRGMISFVSTPLR